MENKITEALEKYNPDVLAYHTVIIFLLIYSRFFLEL